MWGVSILGSTLNSFNNSKWIVMPLLKVCEITRVGQLSCSVSSGLWLWRSSFPELKKRKNNRYIAAIEWEYFVDNILFILFTSIIISLELTNDWLTINLLFP